jgi:hypothetical protein
MPPGRSHGAQDYHHKQHRQNGRRKPLSRNTSPKSESGKVMPTKAVISGLARELDSDVRYLEKLAEEIGKGN